MLSAENNIVKVKLVGDGTYVGKFIHLVNFTCVILNESNPNSVTRNYPLVIFRGDESYECLNENLAGVRNVIESFKVFQYNNIEYQIQYFMAGD